FAAELVYVVVGNERTAVLAAGVVAVAAIPAQDMSVVALVIVAVNACAAFVAQDGQLARAVRTEQVVADAEHLVECVSVAAVGTDMGGLHGRFLLFNIPRQEASCCGSGRR